VASKLEYIKFVQGKLNLDENKSEQVISAVMQTLHERLTEDQAEHVETHLPVEVKPLWWSPSLKKSLPLLKRQPAKYNFAEFINKVKERAELATDAEAKSAVKTVFQLLKIKIPEKESANVATQLPHDIEEFWQAA
jgi:uncharacterized protein (DUF2267 family)